MRLSARRMGKEPVRIDRRAFPPAQLRPQLENGEMQVRTIGRCVTGTAHEAQDSPFRKSGPLQQALRSNPKKDEETKIRDLINKLG